MESSDSYTSDYSSPDSGAESGTEITDKGGGNESDSDTELTGKPSKRGNGNATEKSGSESDIFNVDLSASENETATDNPDNPNASVPQSATGTGADNDKNADSTPGTAFQTPVNRKKRAVRTVEPPSKKQKRCEPLTVLEDDNKLTATLKNNINESILGTKDFIKAVCVKKEQLVLNQIPTVDNFNYMGFGYFLQSDDGDLSDVALFYTSKRGNQLGTTAKNHVTGPLQRHFSEEHDVTLYRQKFCPIEKLTTPSKICKEKGCCNYKVKGYYYCEKHLPLHLDLKKEEWADACLTCKDGKKSEKKKNLCFENLIKASCRNEHILLGTIEEEEELFTLKDKLKTFLKQLQEKALEAKTRTRNDKDKSIDNASSPTSLLSKI